MIELMEFAGVAVWLLSLSLIGLPVLLTARPAEPAALVLAPVYGFALMGVLSTVLYTAGLNGRQQYFLFVALGAAASLSLLLWRRRTGFRFGGGGLIAAALAAWAAVIGLLLAGKAIGGYRYFVFQGNHWDHLNYLTNAALYAREDYKTVVDAVLGRTLGILTPALDANPIATIAPLCYENRPGVTLVLSALSAAPGWPQGTRIEATAFVYLCFLASLPVFPLTLCAGRLFRAPAPLAGAV